MSICIVIQDLKCCFLHKIYIYIFGYIHFEIYRLTSKISGTTFYIQGNESFCKIILSRITNLSKPITVDSLHIKLVFT